MALVEALAPLIAAESSPEGQQRRSGPAQPLGITLQEHCGRFLELRDLASTTAAQSGQQAQGAGGVCDLRQTRFAESWELLRARWKCTAARGTSLNTPKPLVNQAFARVVCSHSGALYRDAICSRYMWFCTLTRGCCAGSLECHRCTALLAEPLCVCAHVRMRARVGFLRICGTSVTSPSFLLNFIEKSTKNTLIYVPRAIFDRLHFSRRAHANSYAELGFFQRSRKRRRGTFRGTLVPKTAFFCENAPESRISNPTEHPDGAHHYPC